MNFRSFLCVLFMGKKEWVHYCLFRRLWNRMLHLNHASQLNFDIFSIWRRICWIPKTQVSAQNDLWFVTDTFELEWLNNQWYFIFPSSFFFSGLQLLQREVSRWGRNTCLSFHFNCIICKWQMECTGNNLIVMFFTDRARVAGGLPDVVTIQEGKVSVYASPYGLKRQKWQKITKLSPPSSLWIWPAISRATPYLRSPG